MLTGAHFRQLLTSEPENEITLTAFRLLTMDLLVLFHAMNEGTINVLGESPTMKARYMLRDCDRALFRNVKVRCRTRARDL